jgi:uncharacterized membrane protein
MHTIHQKGYDAFTTTDYGTGHQWLQAALEADGMSVTHLPNHLAAAQFPSSRESLAAWDVIILSDIGSNTLLLHPDTFVRSQRTANRRALLREWVEDGGGLVMVGGYLTFAGIEGKGKWAGTPVEEVLPVSISLTDDRVERPEGVVPTVLAPDHPIVARSTGAWPVVLGYNRLTAKPDAEVVVAIDGDPLLALRAVGKGRTVAFASDCAPHWLPPEFVGWSGYDPLWTGIVRWAAHDEPQGA